MKKLFCLRFTAFLLMSVLAFSCLLMIRSDGDKKTDNIWDTICYPSLPTYDLGGYEVKFAVAEAAEDDGFNERSITANSDTGDRVNTAVYSRNRNVEIRCNCKISLTFVDNENIADTAVKNALLAGSSEYDIIAARQYDDIALCSEGVVLDLYANETTRKHLDITQPWWDLEYIRNMTYDKKVYWLTGDISLRYIGGLYATFVNGKIYEDKLMRLYGHIHDIVEDGRWTVDMMKEMSDKVTTVETELSPGNIDDGDIIGVAFPIHDNTNGLAVSCGVRFSYKTNDGSVVFNVTSSNRTLRNYYTKYMELLNTPGCVDYSAADEYGAYSAAFDDFRADKVLFVPGRLNQAELYLQNMESTYYIIPNPKLDIYQQEYISGVHDAISIYGINPNSKNIEASAIVLEEMAAESYRSVKPEYYDLAIKNKYTSDPYSKKMIDIISSNVYSDFALVWAYTDYFKCDIGGNLGNFLRENFRNGIPDITTSVEMSYFGGWNRAMSEIADAFALLD